MAPRVRHTGAAAEALRRRVAGLKKAEGAAKTARLGITTFIQKVLRNGVKFSPRRSKSSGTRSGTALARGRAAHRLIEAYCNDGTLPPRWRKDPVSKWARGVADCLVRAGIEPLRTELPCHLSGLKTQVDMLGMVLPKDAGAPELVCVEFKTTSHTHKDHQRDYDAVCQRRAVFGGGFGLPNSEREAHRVQCAFGSEALRSTYPALGNTPIRGTVIVASTTSTACYNVKPVPASHFQIASSIGAITAKTPAVREKLTDGRLFPPLPPKRSNGAAIRAALARSGHTGIRKSARASCLSRIADIEFAVGVCEGWQAFSAAHRASVAAEIAEIARPSRRPALVVFDGRHRLWKVVYV